MRLLFVVSDHGFGHATRSVALLRAALAKERGLGVRIVSGPGAAYFLSASFEGDSRVEIAVRASDPGMHLLPGTLRVDTPGTAAAWRDWIESWDGWAAREAIDAGPIDAVLTDGPPPGLLVAREKGVPSLLLGNFAWSDTLAWHLPDDLLDRIRKTLSLATAAFAYPYSLGFDGAPRPKHLPLVARRPTRSREMIRRAIGIDGEPLVYLSAGQSSSPDSVWDAARGSGARLLVPWNAPELPGEIRIPRSETESQDYLAACDLIVGKVGYGTLSEAFVAGVPMVMVLVDRTPETVPLSGAMLAAGAGETLDEGEDFRPAIGRWLGRRPPDGRSYAQEDCSGAAGILLDEIRRLAVNRR